jgi:hypothetical protein
MTKQANYISSFTKAFAKAGIEVTGVDENIGDPQDFEVMIVTQDEDGTEHAEGLYFAIDDHGIVTRHDFSGEKRWGHVYAVGKILTAAFAEGAKWLDGNGNGDF